MSAEYPHKLTRDAMVGCCGEHGHLCRFHEGFNDGVEAHAAWARNQDRLFAVALARMPDPELEGEES